MLQQFIYIVFGIVVQYLCKQCWQHFKTRVRARMFPGQILKLYLTGPFRCYSLCSPLAPLLPLACTSSLLLCCPPPAQPLPTPPIPGIQESPRNPPTSLENPPTSLRKPLGNRHESPTDQPRNPPGLVPTVPELCNLAATLGLPPILRNFPEDS